MSQSNGERYTSRTLIRSFEAKELRKRPFIVKIADSLTSFFGSLTFLGFNAFIFTIWLLINTGTIPIIPIFDPFPFILLTMIVSLEAIFLTVIVLLSQNRQGLVNSLREELDLQVNLLSERELTKTLSLLSDIHRHLGIKRDADPELESMLKDIDTSYIERKLETQIRGEQRRISSAVTKPISKLTETMSKSLTTPIVPGSK